MKRGEIWWASMEASQGSKPRFRSPVLTEPVGKLDAKHVNLLNSGLKLVLNL